MLARGGENGRHEFTHTTPYYDSKAQADTRKSETYVRYFYPSGSSVMQKESETDWSQSRTIAKSLTHVSHSKSSHPPSPIGRRSRGGEPTDPKISTTRNLEPALGRDGFDVLGSWLATVPAKELRLKAWERTKTRVSLAGQIHCGYLTQLHVGAGPVRE